MYSNSLYLFHALEFLLDQESYKTRKDISLLRHLQSYHSIHF